MIKALRYFWKEQPIALSALVLGLCVLVFFGARFASGFIYFHDPAHRNEALQSWMTPKYVSMSYRLPREEIQEIMQLGAYEGKRVKLSDVTERMGITLEELETRVRAAKRAFEEKKRAEKRAQDLREEQKRAEKRAHDLREKQKRDFREEQQRAEKRAHDLREEEKRRQRDPKPVPPPPTSHLMSPTDGESHGQQVGQSEGVT